MQLRLTGGRWVSWCTRCCTAARRMQVRACARARMRAYAAAGLWPVRAPAMQSPMPPAFIHACMHGIARASMTGHEVACMHVCDHACIERPCMATRCAHRQHACACARACAVRLHERCVACVHAHCALCIVCTRIVHCALCAAPSRERLVYNVNMRSPDVLLPLPSTGKVSRCTMPRIALHAPKWRHSSSNCALHMQSLLAMRPCGWRHRHASTQGRMHTEHPPTSPTHPPTHACESMAPMAGLSWAPQSWVPARQAQ